MSTAVKTFVDYKDKSGAKRGFVRAFKDLEASADKYICQIGDKWGFWKDGNDKPCIRAMLPTKAAKPASKPAPKKATKTAQAPAAAAPAPTPDVGVLSAMVPAAGAAAADPELEAAVEEPEEVAPSPVSAFGAFAASQLGADKRPEPPVPQRASSATKVQKNRPESNGVKRPSDGTVCAQVWELAASLCGPDKIASLSEVVKAAEAKGINKFTARTQYARWRVFHKA